MRIRIEVTESEKMVIANVAECDLEKDDVEEIVTGKWGTMHYVPNAKTGGGDFEINFKLGFINDIMNIINSIIGLCKAFASKWDGENVSKTFIDGVEVVKSYNEDYTSFEWVSKEKVEKEVKTTEATNEEVKEA